MIAPAGPFEGEFAVELPGVVDVEEVAEDEERGDDVGVVDELGLVVVVL